MSEEINGVHPEEEIEVEIVESEIVEEAHEPVEMQSMDALEQEFGAFVSEIESTTSDITTNINMDELNEIGEEIIKAKAYLTSFANGEKKTTREKAYNQLVSLPLIGGWAKDKVEEAQLQHVKDSGVKDVLKSMFDNFDIKKKRLVELTGLADTIRTNLIAQEGELAVYIVKLDNIIEHTTSPTDKMRALDMSIQAQSSDKIIKDQVHNKLHFIVDMMEALHMRMSKTIPTLKAQLLNETSIAGMITSIADSVKMMDSLQSLTNDIAKTSTENIQGLIVDVTKSLTDGVDVEFYRKSAETNEKFQQTMIECSAKRIKSTVKAYDTLKEIGVDTSNQLERRVHSEKVALGMSIGAAKERVEDVSAAS